MLTRANDGFTASQYRPAAGGTGFILFKTNLNRFQMFRKP